MAALLSRRFVLQWHELLHKVLMRDYRPGVYLNQDVVSIVMAYSALGGQLQHTLTAYDIHDLCPLPDGRVASGQLNDHDGPLVRLNLTSGSWEPIGGHIEASGPMCVLPDGRLAAVDKHNCVRVWNLQSGVYEFKLKGTGQHITCMCLLLPDRVVIATHTYASPGDLRIWNLTTSGACEAVLKGHTCYIKAVCALLDGRVMSASQDRTLRIWNSASGECEAVLTQPSRSLLGGFNSLCVLPDGREVSGDDAQLESHQWRV
jgi:WD40 repeat protein